MLESFIFFHLGSDADLSVTVHGEGLRVSIVHGRVRPFEFQVGGADLAAMTGDPAVFEEAMLDHLVKNRRS